MPLSLKPRKQPSQQRSGFTVDVMLEAAIRILLTDGYQRLTTANVAERAGVSVGSLYQYFPNKQALVAEIVARRADEILQRLIATPTANAKTLEEAVARVMTSLIEVKRERLDLSRALQPALPEVQGRRLIQESTRRFLSTMADKLSLHLPGETAESLMDRLAFAVASVDGALWEAIEQRPEVLADDDFRRVLERIFVAAIRA